eukprot:gene8643-11683_t
MKSSAISIIISFLQICTINGWFTKNIKSTSKSFLKSATWQEDLDSIVNIDTPCTNRRESALEIIKKLPTISSDVIEAIQEQDITKIAPKNSLYGKALLGIQSFQQQLVSDIIPDILTKNIPQLVDNGPKIITGLIEKGPKPADFISKGQTLIEELREISSDPSKLQSTVEDLRRELNNAPNLLQSTVEDVRREVRNIVKSTPEGFDTSAYTVLASTEDFEIREYDDYTVCSTPLTSSILPTPATPTTFDDSTPSDITIDSTSDSIAMDPLVTGESFNKLAGYIFGSSSSSEKISMTVPVIMGNGKMSFVLPKNYTIETAPVPTSSDVIIESITSELIATREFSGIATETESNRQKAKLEDSLINQGIVYDPNSFKVYQYNPPYTLPWVRRNEVSFKILTPKVAISKMFFESKDASEYFSAPEAGD